MLKPTSTYKMSKQTKVLLANIVDPHKRGEIKRSAIQADLYSAIQYKSPKNNKDRSGE